MTLKPLNNFVVEITDCQTEIDNAEVIKLFKQFAVLVLRNRYPVSIEYLKKLVGLFGNIYSSNKHIVNKGDIKFDVSKQLRSYHEDDELQVVRVSSCKDSQGCFVGALGQGVVGWHSDFSHLKGDFHGSILYNKKNGKLAETVFCDCSEVFDLVSIALKSELSKAYGYHSLDASVGTMDKRKRERLEACGVKIGRFGNVVKRPLVVDSSSSPRGRESLYLSPATLIRTSIDIDIKRLFSLLDRKEFHYNHQWEANDILIFDNLTCVHRRPKFKGERTLNRIHFDYSHIFSELS